MGKIRCVKANAARSSGNIWKYSRVLILTLGSATVYLVPLSVFARMCAWPQELDYKLRCVLQQATKLVEGQYDGQETGYNQRALGPERMPFLGQAARPVDLAT